MNIRPLHDRVVVHRLEEKERTSAGGIVIPDSAAEKPSEGKVVAVGPGKFENGETRPLSVKVGDRILFGKYAGTEVKISGKEYVVMREDDIMGVLTEK
ncbi:MAG: co-chaperone GroES [Coxiella endosymbiont of Dermacentor nuttalli]